MNTLDDPRRPEAEAERRPRPDRTAEPRRSWTRYLSVTNIGIIYVLIGLIVVFSILAPETFPTWTTVRSVLNGAAVPGLIALALVIPLSARLFDLSVGNAMGLANVLVAWLLVEQGWGVAPAVLVTLLAGLAMGAFNGLVVVSAKIDSFIGTLATGALFATVVTMLADQSVTGPQLGGAFGAIATTGLFGLTLPLYLLLAVAVAFWFFQKYTVTGRRVYALGFNERGAELVGIRTRRLKFASLIAAGFVVSVAGILLASSVNSGTPHIGPPYLLDAYAAAFLGATQFGGRFNAFGTLLAVILLGVGTNGIFLIGGAAWAQSLFGGVVLLLALGASNLEQAIRARSWIRAKARQAAAP
ncbi:ABC transporter permease [Actinocorallia sp. API 0066]|uniref:ABC transporter permease n=1 Tax=Actinocorallia sp. API 0066 TaxID=2896846 RepID=UPI001E5C4E4E|nr:ABC transporter permease [Actinocorallia sp. API 0066]MCD0449161.1 ABC transporter permease [Actinocorallia sp. API 0066]